MPDYQRGKIYKITSGDLTYIGSTCEPTLARRLSGHVVDYKRWKDGKFNKLTSFQLIETGNYEITLIELCPCGSKDELTARERHWIETIPCVNRCIPGRTDKEYREVNKVIITERKIKYNEDHKEQRKEYQKKYEEDHKEQRKEYQKKYEEDHKEQRKEYQKKYEEDHKEEAKARYQLNKEKILAKQKEKRLQKSKPIIT